MFILSLSAPIRTTLFLWSILGNSKCKGYHTYPCISPSVSLFTAVLLGAVHRSWIHSATQLHFHWHSRARCNHSTVCEWSAHGTSWQSGNFEKVLWFQRQWTHWIQGPWESFHFALYRYTSTTHWIHHGLSSASTIIELIFKVFVTNLVTNFR